MFWKIQDRRQKYKYRKTHIEYNSEVKKQTTQNTTKQNHPGLVAFYDTRPGNEVGLFYNAPEHTVHTGLWAHEAWQALYQYYLLSGQKKQNVREKKLKSQ